MPHFFLFLSAIAFLTSFNLTAIDPEELTPDSCPFSNLDIGQQMSFSSGYIKANKFHKKETTADNQDEQTMKNLSKVFKKCGQLYKKRSRLNLPTPEEPGSITLDSLNPDDIEKVRTALSKLESQLDNNEHIPMVLSFNHKQNCNCKKRRTGQKRKSSAQWPAEISGSHPAKAARYQPNDDLLKQRGGGAVPSSGHPAQWLDTFYGNFPGLAKADGYQTGPINPGDFLEVTLTELPEL